MVTVSDYKSIQKKNGEIFYCLVVEGSVEPVRSEKTGRIYLTSRRASVPTTFDEKTCKKVIGTEFPGEVKKVECDPYDYTIQETGEIIELAHRWEMVDESLEIMEKHMVKKKEIIK